MRMGIRQFLFAVALAVPLIGGIAMLEGSLGRPGNPQVPAWFIVPFLWALLLNANADRFFPDIDDRRPTRIRFPVSRIMLGLVVLYAAAWTTEMVSFAFRYVEGRGDLAGLLKWGRSSRYSWLPGGVGALYLYTLAFSMWAAIQGYDRVKHHEELVVS